MVHRGTGVSAGRVDANDVRRTPTFRAGAPIEGDERVTNLDQSGRERLEPRPVSRPPVDPASKRAFGRPEGVGGSFTGVGQYRDQGEYTPRDQAPDPVLAEAFARPGAGGDSLQRHPTDAGALDAEREKRADEPDDPWRNPGSAAALGTPAFAPTVQAPTTAVV